MFSKGDKVKVKDNPEHPEWAGRLGIVESDLGLGPIAGFQPVGKEWLTERHYRVSLLEDASRGLQPEVIGSIQESWLESARIL